MKSLRAQLTLFWVILLTVCVALALVMLVLFRSSAGAQVEAARAHAEAACSAIATRYAKSLADPRREAPQLDLLQVLLQLVLIEEPHVEGGVWRTERGFPAYAYPTREGSSVKRDVPEAERERAARLCLSVPPPERRDADAGCAAQRIGRSEGTSAARALFALGMAETRHGGAGARAGHAPALAPEGAA